MRTLKSRVSCESIEVPEYQPLTDWRPLRSCKRRYGQGIYSSDEHHGSVDAQASDYRAHRVGIGHGGQDDLGSSEFLKFGGGIVRLTVDVAPGSELFGERFFVLPARNRDGSEALLGSVLNA